MQTVDLDTWEPRDATMQEYNDLVTVLDALPNCHINGGYPYFGYKGVPPVMCIPEGIAIKIRNSTKIQLACNADDSDQFNIEMIKAAGGEPILPITGSAPLTWYDNQLRATYRAIEAGFLIYVIQGTMLGSTGPATVAGTAVVNLAQELSLIVLVQVLAPGARVQIGGCTWPQNMKTGSPGFGRIGCGLVMAVENQISRSYGIPTWGCTASPTNSKKPDFQAGYEKGINALTGALTGSNVLEFHSALYGELTAHPMQAVLDDDVAGMIGRFIRGVTVSDETIALDLIEQVGPIPGNYLNTAHTREWWKKEQFIPKACDDLTYPEWMKTSKKDCISYAKEVMEKILTTHRVSIPLTSSQEDDIGRILKEARKYYREKGMISDEQWEIYQREVLNLPDYPFG